MKRECKCAICESDRAFDIPPHLLDELKRGSVVVFAGAGISTENKSHADDTFYLRIVDELGIAEDLSFPQLMQRYCDQPDGRIKLISRIKDRFAYFRSFDDFYRPMTRFHRSIAPMFMIKDIITTNWDDFFERECDLDAFVNDDDMALWGASKRRLLKIHGSIRNPASIVATTDDYKRSLRRLEKGPLGAQLKIFLSQKTIIYTGYSLSDENYKTIASTISKMLRPYRKQAYFISPEIDSERLKSLPIDLIPIQTDGSYFFEQVRIHLQDEMGIIPNESFMTCEEILVSAQNAHDRTVDLFMRRRHPLIPFALSYQDGLIHGLQRIRDRKLSGEYHDQERVHRTVRGYLEKEKSYLKDKDLWNAQYASGYGSALMLLLMAREHPVDAIPPLFGNYKNEAFYSITSLLRYKRDAVLKTHIDQAERIYSQTKDTNRDLVPDHTPYC